MCNNLRQLVFLFLVFISSYSFAQQQLYDDYEKKAGMLMEKIRAKTNSEEDKKELSRIAIGFQNYGQNFDQLSHDYINSLKYVDKAIAFFICLDDTAGIANNKKFNGYLLGRLKRFPEAKQEIKTAIELYSLLKRDNGVAVSQFDLAKVYASENKIDSAIYYCDISSRFWKAKNDSGRIFNNQNMMIDLLTKMGDIKNAKALQEETTKYNAAPKNHWLSVIDFYTVSIHLFTAANEKENVVRYEKLLDDKKAELKKQNIEAHSYYENE